MPKLTPLLLLLTTSALAGGGNAPSKATSNPIISVQDNQKHTQIRVVVRSAAGKVLWQTQIEGQLGERDPARSWGVLDGTLWISVLRGVQDWHTDGLGYRLSDGKKLWCTKCPFFLSTPPWNLTRVKALFSSLSRRSARSSRVAGECFLLVDGVATGFHYGTVLSGEVRFGVLTMARANAMAPNGWRTRAKRLEAASRRFFDAEVERDE